MSPRRYRPTRQWREYGGLPMASVHVIVTHSTSVLGQGQVLAMTPKRHRPTRQWREYGGLPRPFNTGNLTLTAYPRPHSWNLEGFPCPETPVEGVTITNCMFSYFSIIFLNYEKSLVQFLECQHFHPEWIKTTSSRSYNISSCSKLTPTIWILLGYSQIIFCKSSQFLKLHGMLLSGLG